MPHRNRVVDGLRPRIGNLGRVKDVTSNRERTLLSGLLNHTSVEDIFQLNSFAGSLQSTDFYFYKQCLLFRQIRKWVLTQKTLKFIAEVENEENDESHLSISQTSSNDD